jgi:hypothetical protein
MDNKQKTKQNLMILSTKLALKKSEWKLLTHEKMLDYIINRIPFMCISYTVNSNINVNPFYDIFHLKISRNRAIENGSFRKKICYK